MSEVFDPISAGLEISGIAIVYAVTVLTLLSLVIKALTTVFKPREAVAAMASIASEEIKEVSIDENTLFLALATVAIHRYLSEKSHSITKGLEVLRMSPWVSSWRLECSSTYDDLELSVRSRRR